MLLCCNLCIGVLNGTEDQPAYQWLSILVPCQQAIYINDYDVKTHAYIILYIDKLILDVTCILVIPFAGS